MIEVLDRLIDIDCLKGWRALIGAGCGVTAPAGGLRS